jgi:hypothetical protein
MNTAVDMNYRFVWDKEPTDEQLQVIMQEVGEEARLVCEQVAAQIKEKLRRDFMSVGQQQLKKNGKA